MKSALIGFTGFIGSNLAKQRSFTNYYNSKNIQTIQGEKFDLIISAGTSSLRWQANLKPQEDLQKIKELTNCLRLVKANHFILISTVDVYPFPVRVNEDSLLDVKRQNPYGQNRYFLEKFVKKNFKSCTFIRLPQTFGPGLKKNFVFDLIHNHCLDFTHKDSLFQWYNLKYLWEDINLALKKSLELVNFAVEPISASELAKATLNFDFKNITQNPPLCYDVRTKYGAYFKSKDNYLYHKKNTFKELRVFILSEKNR